MSKYLYFLHSRLLDREKVETIKLVLTVEDMAAIEGGPRQTASATLTVVIDDENDNNPKFRKPFYKTSIPENSKIGVNIATVIADDADKNKSMTYLLEGKLVSYTILNATHNFVKLFGLYYTYLYTHC